MKFKKAKIIIGIFLITLSLLFYFSLEGQASLRIEPSRFILSVKPGERITDSIKVTNNTNQTLNLVANYYDWELDENYEMELLDKGSIKESLDGLIRFNPRVFSLNPGEEQLLRFTVKLPDGEKDLFERRGVIFIEHEGNYEEETGAAVKSMIGSTVYVMPAGQGFTFNIRDNFVLKTQEGEFYGAALVYNDSGRHVRFKMDYKILDSNGEILLEDESQEWVVLPDEERSVYYPIGHDFSAGIYELVLTFLFSDTDETLTDVIAFEISD